MKFRWHLLGHSFVQLLIALLFKSWIRLLVLLLHLVASPLLGLASVLGLMPSLPGPERRRSLRPFAWLARIPFKLLDVLALGEWFDLLSLLVKVRTRGMTELEIAEARHVFGDAIAYRQIRIDEGSWIARMGARYEGSTDMGVVTFHTINFTRDLEVEPGNVDMAWLIHELTHVLQYERLGSQYLAEAVYAQMTDGYDYGGAKGLRDKVLRDFNREQQGDIVRDYYRGVLCDRAGGYPCPDDLPVYLPRIQELVKGGEWAIWGRWI